MLRWLRGFAAPLAAILLFTMVPVTARAVTVKYYTTGVFTNPSGSIAGRTTTLTAGGQGVKITTSGASVTLNFAGIGSLLTPVIGVPTGNVLASFSETFTGALNGVNFTTVTDVADFLLTIHQVVPAGTATTGSSSVTVTGRIRASDSPGHFNILFTPNPVAVPSTPAVSYLLSNLNSAGQLEITENPRLLKADIVAVPTPASVWGGMGLLGLVGLVKLSRKQLAV